MDQQCECMKNMFLFFVFFSWIRHLSVKCKSYELKHRNTLIKMLTHTALAISHLLHLIWVVGTLSSPLPAHSLGFWGIRDLEAPLWPHDRYPGLRRLPNSRWFFPKSLAWDSRAPMILPTWSLDFLTHLSVFLSTWLPWPARGCPPLPIPQSCLRESAQRPLLYTYNDAMLYTTHQLILPGVAETILLYVLTFLSYINIYLYI